MKKRSAVLLLIFFFHKKYRSTVILLIYIFHKKEIIQSYYKKCSKHTPDTFPKKLVLISTNKIKGKSRCAICLTERSFIDEVQYDLESALEIYLHFFTD